MASSINISKIISNSFDDLKANYGTHLISTVVASFIASAAFGLLAGPMQVGYMKMEQKIADGGKPEISDIFKGFDAFVPSLVAFIVSMIVISIGFVLCVIPGLLLMPLLPVSLYLVARGEGDGVLAVKRAWGCLKDNLFMAMIASILITALGCAGVVLCFVGIYLTLPLIYVGSYHMARQLTGDAPV